MLAVQTGLRLSELIGLNRDAILDAGASRAMCCKGRIDARRCPHMFGVLSRHGSGTARKGATALSPNVHGGRFSDDSIQSLLAKHVRAARETCLSLKSKRVSPHVLRHGCSDGTAAGGDGRRRDRAVALGMNPSRRRRPTCMPTSRSRRQRSPSSKYEGAKRTRFRPNDRLLAFLEAL